MLDHHIQKQIIYRLAFEDSLRFSELQPSDIENKLFNYHLKKVVSAGFVEKDDTGSYRLTSRGRRIGKGALSKDDRFIDRAYSILILVVRSRDGSWLLFERKSQPLLGYIGFMQAKPVSGISVAQTAQTTLRDMAGMSGIFEVAGQAFLTMRRDGILESYINSTVLVCNDATGELTNNDPNGTYLFVNQLPVDNPRAIPSIKLLADIAEGKLAFGEATFELDSLDSAI